MAGSKASQLAGAIAVAVLMAVLFASVAIVAPDSPSLGHASANGGPLATLAAPASPTPRNLTFDLHNSTVAHNVNGVSSPYLFDTLRTFGRNVTVSAFQDVRQDWYLYPLLAGSLRVNGTVALHAYVSATGTTPQVTPKLQIYERNAIGAEILVSDTTFGSQTGWNTPHDLALAITLQHTFAARSSIHVILEIVAGTRTVTIWYNATWVPSHIIMQSNDYARVENIAFLDSTGKARISFDPSAPNKDIRTFANVTDPLGGYDLKWVNLTLRGPGSLGILSMVPMVPASWPASGFRSNFTYLWNYSGRPVGAYNATVRVVDYSGFYARADTSSWVGNFHEMAATFYIGGLPYYVNLRAVDSRGIGLAGAPLVVVSGGVAIDQRLLDAQGQANVSFAGGSYTLQVYWQLLKVASYPLTPTGNVSAQSPLIISTAVYYPTIAALDSLGSPLAGAAVILQHPNGTQFGPVRTDALGQIHLTRMAGGSYGIEIDWRGIQVFKGPVALTDNSIKTVPCAVFQLTVHVVDQANAPLVGAFVSLQDSTGLVFDANITDATGTAGLRLPQGTYDVLAKFRSEYLGSAYAAQGNTTLVLDSSKATTITVPVSKPSFTTTVVFPLLLAYVLTTVVLATLLFLLWTGRLKPRPLLGRRRTDREEGEGKGETRPPARPPTP